MYNTYRRHIVLKRGKVLRHSAPNILDESLLGRVEAVAIAVQGECTCTKEAPLARAGVDVPVEIQVEDVASTRLGGEEGDA